VSVEEDLQELGPIDYIVLEWPTAFPDSGGEVARLLTELVDRGTIRILDIAFMAKDQEGNIAAIDLAEDSGVPGFEAFVGASSGLIGEDDIREAANVLEGGTAAAILVWENRWAAPVARALRQSGGQLVASGRIPVQAILAALDATEAITN